MPVEVTLAPKSLVPETEMVPVLNSAALRSKLPVTERLPRRLVAPTVSAVLSPKTSVPVPRAAVKFWGVDDELLTVPKKLTLLFVVVSVTGPVIVVAPLHDPKTLL